MAFSVVFISIILTSIDYPMVCTMIAQYMDDDNPRSWESWIDGTVAIRCMGITKYRVVPIHRDARLYKHGRVCKQMVVVIREWMIPCLTRSSSVVG